MTTDALKSMVIPAPRKSVVRATVAAVEALILPVAWYSGWIEIHNDGTAKLALKFGISSAEVSAMSALTAVSANVPPAEATQPTGTPGLVLEAGERVYRDLGEMDFASLMNADSRIWIAHLAAAAGGFLRICQSSGPTPA